MTLGRSHLSEKQTRKSILVVSTTNTANDVRIMRHINFLVRHFDVISVGYGESPSNVKEHIRIPGKKKYLPLSIITLIPHVLRFFRVSSQQIQAIRFIRRTVQTDKFDLVLLNDVETLPLITSFNCPVVVDMHEYAPLQMEEDWRFRILLQRYYTWLCKNYLPRASAVTTVSHGLAMEYHRNFGVRCTVVMNAREYRDLKVRELNSPPVLLVHSGLAARARRLDVMIRAVANLSDFILDMYLVSAPHQSRTLRRLKKLANKTTNVRILNPVDSEKLPEVLNNYDISLLYIAPTNFSLEHCMPNKLFDSIQARIGVVTGPSPDLVEFSQINRVGHSTALFSSAELRKLLISLDKTEINAMKKASDVCSQMVTAESEERKLLNTLSKFV